MFLVVHTNVSAVIISLQYAIHCESVPTHVGYCNSSNLVNFFLTTISSDRVDVVHLPINLDSIIASIITFEILFLMKICHTIMQMGSDII